jgi:hypothetical protein
MDLTAFIPYPSRRVAARRDIPTIPTGATVVLAGKGVKSEFGAAARLAAALSGAS